MAEDLGHSVLQYHRTAHIAISGDNIYIIWHDDNRVKSGLFFRVSTDGGQTFGPIINLSTSTGVGNPEIVAEGNNVYVTYWETAKNGIGILNFTASTDGGKKFAEKIILNN